MSGAAAYASRRGLPRERVFLAALLAAALLLASGLMLHRQADGACATTCSLISSLARCCCALVLPGTDSLCIYI